MRLAVGQPAVAVAQLAAAEQFCDTVSSPLRILNDDRLDLKGGTALVALGHRASDLSLGAARRQTTCRSRGRRSSRCRC